MLIDNKLLDDPILYISYYFKKHHAQYYQALDRVRTHGDFEGWMSYYLQAVAESALDANLRIKEIEALELKLKEQIKKDPQFIKSQEIALIVLSSLFASPITTVSIIGKAINKTHQTTTKIVTKFIELGILSQTIQTLDKRYKQYKFHQYLDLLEKEYLKS